MLANVLFEILAKKLQPAGQRLHGPRSQGTEGVTGAQQPGQFFQSVQSAGTPRPASIEATIFSAQGRPSRHGVHQPHDSRAKETIRLATVPTGQCDRRG